jgi:hypothetical protein
MTRTATRRFFIECAAARADGFPVGMLRRFAVIELQHSAEPLAAENLHLGLADVVDGIDGFIDDRGAWIIAQ